MLVVDEQEEALDADVALQVQVGVVRETLGDLLAVEGAQVLEQNHFVLLSSERHVYEVFKHRKKLFFVESDLVL